MLDLVVIGAGPHALSLLTRIIDDQPDLRSERERTHHAKRAGSRGHSHSQIRSHLRNRYDAAKLLPKTLVIDIHGTWMQEWKNNFQALGIEHTRSHADLHPCPFDFASLREWTVTQKRQHELWDMSYIDRESSRKSGYAGPFMLVGVSLFNDFCDALVLRYNVAPLVRRGTVDQVIPVPSDDGDVCTFELNLRDGRKYLCRRVVCALGPGPMFSGMRSRLPDWAEDLQEELEIAGVPQKLLHSQNIVPRLNSALRRTSTSAELPPRGSRVLVIGGGQTAGHLALLGRRLGLHITIASRRNICIKPYDVDLELVGDHRADVLRRFWKLADPEERVRFISDIRGGGSMSPEIYSELKKIEDGNESELDECRMENAEWSRNNADAYSVKLLQATQVHDAKLSTEISDADLVYKIEIRFDDNSTSIFDDIWLATGGVLDMNLVPLLALFKSHWPIPEFEGLPLLQPDLSWDVKCPLYIMGAFAQMELGPDALNLAGARSGSVLIAKSLIPFLRDEI